MFVSKENYKACIYARLSKDDGDKPESDSIGNQKALIRDFLKNHPEIRVVSEQVDDGYSGVNFERPGFKAMMEDIRSGKVDCVIVKDLSRFGRNYIEAGNYIERVFPFIGVRFIAMMIACCNDGTRPVIFKIERIDIPETPEEEEWLAKQNFKNSAEDAYTG
ncbi:MAG: recombinase family protein [Lachnospiraceae bacterium]|nr:recombinase family protein [Lachnospiraceae bacterium]